MIYDATHIVYLLKTVLQSSNTAVVYTGENLLIVAAMVPCVCREPETVAPTAHCPQGLLSIGFTT